MSFSGPATASQWGSGQDFDEATPSFFNLSEPLRGGLTSVIGFILLRCDTLAPELELTD